MYIGDEWWYSHSVDVEEKIKEADKAFTLKLNGIKMFCFYKRSKGLSPTHLEFLSVGKKQPNALTETGYRSCYCNSIVEEKDVIEVIKNIMKSDIKEDYILEIDGETIGEECQATLGSW